MKKLLTTLSFFLISSVTYMPKANAQVPCGGVGILGIGPFGIGVVLDCPPPPPTIVVVRPRVRRPVPRPTYAPPPAPVRRRAAQVPPPPVSLRSRMYLPKFTVGSMFDSSSYSDGGMAGAGVYSRFLLGRQLAVEGSMSVLSSCTSCNPESQRVDSNFGLAALYYLNPVNPIGFNLYAKAGLLWKHVEFSNLNTFETSTTEQSAIEIGGGIEWRLTEFVSLNAELTAMGITASEESEFNHGNINDHLSKGIPSANTDNSAVNFKIGVAMHF